MNIFLGKPQITKEEVKEGLDICSRKILQMLPEFTEKFPSAASGGLRYTQVPNTDWTNGFWTGEIWLAYEYCKKEELKEAALVQCADFNERICKKIAVDNHDMGFLYSLSCVAAYKLTGDEKAKKAAIMAADNLLTMYRPKGQFIQSFNQPENEENYKMIVDCLMNLGILYWASEVTGESKYREAAEKHFLTTAKHVFREDGSTKQAMRFDIHTGAYKDTMTHQGYSDDSGWSRGQSWAVYGPAITYKYTQKKECLTLFRQAADYFMDHMPEDLVPYFDFTFTDGNEWPRDSSAGAIAACGLLEMSKYLEKDEAEVCMILARQIAKALFDRCMVREEQNSNGILLHSTYCCKTPYNRVGKSNGVDECCSFGDYFYMELLTRLYRPEWEMYW